MEQDKYAGQCYGGPDRGNFVSSNLEEWYFETESRYYLDGRDKHPGIMKTSGRYRWNHELHYWQWIR